MTDPKEITVSELVEDYLCERLLEPATQRNYREVADRWLRNTGHRVVNQITKQHVVEWRSVILERASAQTWNNYRRNMRALWNYAIRKRICTHNVFADTAPARAPNLRKKTVDLDDLDTIVDALRNGDPQRHNIRPTWFWVIVIKTFYYTGMRRRQLVNLRWKDIRFDKTEIHLRATTSKTLCEWSIPIAEPLLPELGNLQLLTREQLGRSPGEEEQVFNVTLFHNRFQGNELTVDQLSRIFQRLSKTFKIRITPHRLRHTLATNVAPKDVRALQELLGHTDVQTTMGYIHPDMDRLRSLLAGL